MIVTSVKGFSFDGGTTTEKYDYNELDNLPQNLVTSTDLSGALTANVAPAYSTSSTYAVGDYVLYENALYKCVSAINSGESWTAAHWEAVKMCNEVGTLNSQIEDMPDVKDSTKTGVDLDISDPSGNVILRVANGHIQTKEFDSSMAGADIIKDSTKSGVDLDITDPSGNVILRVADGNVSTKYFDSADNMGICYVAVNGSDSNDGTASNPFATFQHAIDLGYKKIIAAPGEYKGQRITMNGLNGISIISNSSQTAITPFESHVRRTRAKIDNSIDVTGLEAYNSIYCTALTVNEESSFYKVFVSQTLDPVYSGSGYYGRVTTYNAILWEITEGIEDCTRLVPKLTLADCEANAGSFHFDGSYLYINPTGGSLGTKTYKRLNLDTNQYGVDIRNCTDIHIQGIDVAFFPYYDIYFKHCEDVIVKDCCFTFTSYGSAAEVAGADATFVSCTAAKAGADGFGIAVYGNVSFYDCNALYCYDDGISHHDAATGVIDGGQWVGCLKGGVTPSFGSNVSVKNVVCKDNVYGIYVTQSGDRVTDATLVLQNCLAVNNSTKDIRVTGYSVISHGCAYGTKQVDEGATLTEYGNVVIS